MVADPDRDAIVVATWTDSTGNSSNPANWSSNPVVPNNGGTTYDVVITGTGDTVTFDASGTLVNDLALDTGETLQDDGHGPTLTIASQNPKS